MGLKDKLTKGGSVLSKYNGGAGVVNPGSGKTSKLHASGFTPGFSLNGNFSPEVGQAYNEYDDGVNNALPPPSNLDINGVNPKGPLKDPSTISINNSFDKGSYRNNPPEGSSF